MVKRIITILLVILLLCCCIDIVTADDTVPPITSIEYDPPNPNGKEGWYNCTVNITLLAIDNESGVNATYYRLNNESWQNYTGIISLITEGKYFIDFYSIDNVGNIESIKSALVKIDKTEPDIDLLWGIIPHGLALFIPSFRFYSSCQDILSGIDRIEFYYNENLIQIDNEPPYEWKKVVPVSVFSVKGLIKLQSYGSRIYAYGLVVKLLLHGMKQFVVDIIGYDNAGNHMTDCLLSGEVELESNPQIYRFLWGIRICVPLILPNNYTGIITPFWINAVFYTE